MNFVDVMTSGSTPSSRPVTVETVSVDGSRLSSAETEDADEVEVDAPAEAAPEADAAPTDVAATDVAAAPDKITELSSLNDRMRERNEALVKEIDELRARGGKAQPSERAKRLEDAERTYIEDPVKSLRLMVSTSLGVAEDDKCVDEELTHLYNDLTSSLLGVDMEPSKKAIRESIRARNMLARDRRERAEEQQAPAVEPTGHMKLVEAQFAAIADKHPLLSTLAEDLSGGAKASALIWDEIGRGIRAGELDPKMSDDQLVAKAASKIEQRFKATAAKIAAKSSTAPVIETASPSKGADQGHGVRSISNAQASVAPATPPPTEKKAPAVDVKRKFRSEAERRRHLASLHFRGE